MKLTSRNIIVVTVMTILSSVLFFFIMYILNKDEMTKSLFWKLIITSLLVGIMINVVNPILIKKLFPQKKKN